MRKQVSPVITIVIIVVVVLTAGIWFWKRASKPPLENVVPGMGRIDSSGRMMQPDSGRGGGGGGGGGRGGGGGGNAAETE